MSLAQPGDPVLLLAQDGKRYLIRLEVGGSWHSHRGHIEHDELIGRPLGRTVQTQHGTAYLALEPSTNDLVQELRRNTQIIYGKDAAHLAFRLNLFSGRTVVEAGTGSGGFTLVLARAVMPAGHVYSYEARPETHALARRNMQELGLMEYVTLYNEDLSSGFHQREVDACFLDMKEPWTVIDQAWEALKGSGFLGCLLPTTNQVSTFLAALQSRPFSDTVVEELLLRRYKPVPSRLRPEDRMMAHSAYLIFARKLARDDAALAWISDKRRRTYYGKQAMAQREAEEALKDGQQEEVDGWPE